MTAYYNEIDPFAAEWLRQLIAAGHIAPGDVDTRSIEDVTPDDLRGYTQCHFFAGIGVWSHALRLAGVPDDAPVWTGSCPCQPFSAAGKRAGQADERHLWPAWFHLIEQCRPALIFGEQVASKDGLGWLDLVSSDLEGTGYACGAEDRSAAGYGAPHIRQRLFFGAYDLRLADEGVDDTTGARRIAARTRPESEARDEARLRGSERGRSAGWLADMPRDGRGEERADGGGIGRGDSAQRLAAGRDTGGAPSGLADADKPRSQGRIGVPERADQCVAGPSSVVSGLADADGGNTGAEREQCGGEHGQQPQNRGADGTGHQGARVGVETPDNPGPTNGFWRDADWLGCRDGKWRPVEPGTFPLAHGATARVGRLRGYGNAIVAPVAQAFVTDFLEAMND